MWAGLVAYFALVALRVLLDYRSLRKYLKLPLVERPKPAAELPAVSVIAPAKAAFEYPDFECVDEQDAHSEWLLFVGRRAELTPESLDRLVRFTLERQSSAIAFFLQQRCETFWERLLLPYAYQQFFSGPRSQARIAALAASQCLLRQRSVGATEALPARAERFGHVRLYVDQQELRAGLQSMSDIRLWPVAALSGLSIACAIFGLASGMPSFELAALVTYVTAVAELSLWEFIFQAPLGYALLQPLAFLTLTGVLLGKLVRRGKG